MISGQRVRMPAMARPRVWSWLGVGREEEVQEFLGLVGPVDFDAPRRMQSCRIQRQAGDDARKRGHGCLRWVVWPREWAQKSRGWEAGGL